MQLTYVVAAADSLFELEADVLIEVEHAAVNKDANAPIFNYCDYGVVGDMDEVCDHMIELLKK